MKIKYIVTLTN